MEGRTGGYAAENMKHREGARVYGEVPGVVLCRVMERNWKYYKRSGVRHCPYGRVRALQSFLLGHNDEPSG